MYVEMRLHTWILVIRRAIEEELCKDNRECKYSEEERNSQHNEDIGQVIQTYKIEEVIKRLTTGRGTKSCCRITGRSVSVEFVFIPFLNMNTRDNNLQLCDRTRCNDDQTINRTSQQAPGDEPKVVPG